MADHASAQAHVARGLVKAAIVLGAPCGWYRPTGAGPALAPGNLIGTLPVLFDTAPDLQQRIPSRVDHPENWFAALDTTAAHVGDYLVDGTLGTFFVATIEFFRPARVVRCNRVLSIARPGGPVPGPDYYPGYIGDAVPLLTGWPCSAYLGMRKEGSDVALPGDSKLPIIELRLPYPGLQLLNNDIAHDEEAAERRYIFSGIELTAQGYRINATQTGA